MKRVALGVGALAGLFVIGSGAAWFDRWLTGASAPMAWGLALALALPVAVLAIGCVLAFGVALLDF